MDFLTRPTLTNPQGHPGRLYSMPIFHRMKLPRRGVLLGVGLLALATASAAATVDVLFFRLPDPAVADVNGIFRWLATRDLVAETPEVRHALVVRLDDELTRGALHETDINERLSPEYHEQFWQNVNLLLEEWFHVQTQKFVAVNPAERGVWIDALIDRVQSWGLLQQYAASHAVGAEAPTNPQVKGSQDDGERPPSENATGDQVGSALSATGELMQRMNDCVERMPPGEARVRAGALAKAIQARVAARTWQGLMQSISVGAAPTSAN